MTSLSVVICTRNRRVSLLETLDSVAPQKCDFPWEVLVVDNGSQDGSDSMVRERAGDFPVPLRLESEPRHGLSFARNTAIERAESDVLVFIDDDVTCLPGWLAAHAALYGREEVVGTAGRIVPALPPETPAWFRELMPDEIGGPTARYDFGDQGGLIRQVGDRPLPLPFGANMGVRKSSARDVGGFRTDLGWGKKMIPCEETEFFRRVEVHGGELHYVPQATLEHRIEAERVTREYYIRWRKGYGRATAIMDPPSGGFRERIAAVKELYLEARRLGEVARDRRASSDESGEILALRDQAEVRGRLLQLVGL